MSKITIYAEKADVAYNIAIAFGGLTLKVGSKTINISSADYNKYKTQIEREHKPKGFIKVSYKGNDYSITWGQGHMASLKNAEDYNSDYANWRKMPLPFFPEKFELKYISGYDFKKKKNVKIDPNKKKQLDLVKKLFLDCDYIINSTDDDREGELIFAYVYEVLKCKKPYKRIFLRSMEEEAIIKAFDNVVDSSAVKSVEMAGRARSIADWLVGANMTAAMTLKFGQCLKTKDKPPLLSVGRVQTTVLNMIVEREKEILNFKPSSSYVIDGKFSKVGDTSKTYTGTCDDLEFKTEQEAKKVLDILMKHQPEIVLYDKKKTSQEAPLLYSQSSIAVDANAQFSMTLKQTLDAAQSLYESGYLTYPRTSSSHLPEDMKSNIDNVLDKLSTLEIFKDQLALVPKSKRRMTKRHFDSSKVGSHFAIVPTANIPDLSKLNVFQRNIYILAAQSVIRSVFPPAVIEKTTIHTKVGDYTFVTNGNVIIEKNWKIVGTDNSKEIELPLLSIGDKVSGDYIVRTKTTKKPSRYTDSSLLGAMISCGKTIEDESLKKFLAVTGDKGGIGTSATRANIVETILTRHYAKRDGKYIIPTELGMEFIDIMPIEDLKNAEISAIWESKMNDIQEGNLSLDIFIQDLQKQISKWITEVNNQEMNNNTNTQKQFNQGIGVACPNCGEDILENDYGFFCSGNKRDDITSCQFRVFKPTKNFNYKPTMSKKDIKMLVEKGMTGNKKAVSKAGKEYEFFYELSEDKQSTVMQFPEKAKSDSKVNESTFICPQCGNSLQHIVSKEKGYDFYACRGHVTVSKNYFGIELSDSELEEILAGEEVGPFITEKDGKSSTRYLYLDGEKIKSRFV